MQKPSNFVGGPSATLQEEIGGGGLQPATLKGSLTATSEEEVEANAAY